jgi:hypothetical protein
MWIFLIELIGFDKNDPEKPSILLSVGKPPSEQSKDIMDENLFIDNQNLDDEGDVDDDDDDFEDGYEEDDLNGFNEYEY